MSYDGPDRRAGNANAALARQDRLTRHLRLMAVAGLAFVAVIVTIALILGFGSISRAEEYAKDARDQAKLNEGLAADIKLLVERQAPCLAGDNPASPACEREATRSRVVAGAIADINAALARGLELHDANNSARIERLEAIFARRPAPAVVRVPITAAPRVGASSPARPPAAPPPATTAAPRPAPPVTTTTTTTCPAKGKRPEHCR